tara:strand:- start:120 stop:617 length:498 start_codon:yes stop_codon:yes gene_type:complete
MPVNIDAALAPIADDILRYLGEHAEQLSLDITFQNNAFILSKHNSSLASYHAPVHLAYLCQQIVAYGGQRDYALPHGWQLDTIGNEIYNATDRIALHAKEAELLRALLEAEGQPITREQLLQQVWGYAESATTNTLETHMYRLRQKLDPILPDAIATVEDGYILR